jgi:hypothetical protein
MISAFAHGYTDILLSGSSRKSSKNSKNRLSKRASNIVMVSWSRLMDAMGRTFDYNFASESTDDHSGSPRPRGPGMQLSTYGDSGSGTPLPALPTKPEKPDLPPFVWPQGGFRNKGEAEDAFLYLLKKEGVDETWTWDYTMRTIITDPLYKVLETLAEKKAVWEKVSQGASPAVNH